MRTKLVALATAALLLVGAPAALAAGNSNGGGGNSGGGNAGGATSGGGTATGGTTHDNQDNEENSNCGGGNGEEDNTNANCGGDGTPKENNGCGEGNGDDSADDPKCDEDDTDTAAPVLDWAFSGTPGTNGWYTTQGTLSVTCVDDVDGAFDGQGGGPASGDGDHDFALSCADAAGNTASEDVTIKIDGTVPTITWSGNRVYDVDELIAVTCAAADVTSGLQSTTCGTSASAVNGNAYDRLAGGSVSGSALDVAGNTATSSGTYSVIPTVAGTCRLIDRFVTNAGVANSLCVKIRNSQAAATRGQAKSELNMLDAFDQEVRAQANKKIVPGGDVILLSISTWFRGN